jgi:hypothetical protein
MKHIRIKLIGNESRLEYLNQFTGIYEISPIKPSNDAQYGTGIRCAYTQLKQYIRFERELARNRDKLFDKPSNSVMSLLRSKRKDKAREAFDSKKPVNKTKHVGVEIEFISSSDRNDIALDLAMVGLTSFVELKHDGSVSDDSSEDIECDGSCREDCNCSDCGETHYCNSEDDCDSRYRQTHGRNQRNDHWEIRDNCSDCDETESIDDCDCGGYELVDGIEDKDSPICKGEHAVCSGHCSGHSCLGYDDHNDYDCNCECNCGGNKDNGHEIAIVAKSSQIADIVNKVCKVLASHNSKVNSTCGLHVHLDMRNHDEKKSFANLVKAQRLLYSMVPSSRFNNSYCQPNDKKSMGGYTGRYWGINPASFSEHGTIEIRLHSGTINAVKINNWIKILQKIAYTNRKMPEIKTLSDLTKAILLPAELLKYISERLNKFSKGRGNFTIANDLVSSEVNSSIGFEESEAA